MAIVRMFENKWLLFKQNVRGTDAYVYEEPYLFTPTVRANPEKEGHSPFVTIGMIYLPKEFIGQKFKIIIEPVDK